MPKLNLGVFAQIYRSGWILLIVSFLTYLLPEFLYFEKEDAKFMLFVFNFVACIGYYIAMLIVKFRQETPRLNIPYAVWVHFVLMFTISAFSLNRSLVVFAPFPIWLNASTLLGVSVFLIFPYFENLSKIIQNLLWVFIGAVLLLSLYFTLYLLPLMPISIIGFFVFGLSLHTFVPVCWLLLIFLLIQRQEKVNWRSLSVGLFIPIFLLLFFLNKWKNIQNDVKDIQAANLMDNKNELPMPIALAQWLPSDKLTDEILIAPFYSQDFWGNGWGLDFDGETKYHNPLAVLGKIFFGDIQLDRSSTEAIMNIRRDQRHKTEERLWSGVSLVTSSITTKVQVFPSYRIAYQEKTINIHNSPQKRNDQIWFVNQTQLALYTFHMPEGSIVTSLSLWIDGKEQKSRLTTRKKADSAFKEIVGVERRDPALVHWKEGNQVVVSVFPCTFNEDRVFKIGFTSPLQCLGQTLIVQNVWFEGPDSKEARELTEIHIAEEIPALKMPEGFMETAAGTWEKKGDYLPFWKINIPITKLNTSPFIFNKKAYSLKEANPVPFAINIKQVYLDLNQNWTKEEYKEWRTILSNKELYVMSASCEKITEANAEILWNKYQKCSFSLPYFHLIKDVPHSLVICHTGHRSPILSDMKKSAYADRLKNYVADNLEPVLVASIGDEISPIYKTLNEFRLIKYLPIDNASLKNAIMKGSFNWVKEDENTVFLKECNLLLTKKDTDDLVQSDGAPDHLMRLFAYNNIVRKVGRDYFNSEQFEKELFREAEEAYVLSPVTSLIVLESEADYKRMGINKNKSTLGNAEIMEGGSVPGPHEWLLITLVVFMIVWYKIKDIKIRIQ
jgi:XrtN system VIT domain protein